MLKEEFLQALVLENIKAGGVYTLEQLKEFVAFVFAQ